MSARIVRSAIVASAAAFSLAATAGGQRFEYAAGSWRYRVVTKVQGTQEAMGQKNDFTVSSGEKFTMSLARQASDTMAMTVTVDSLGSENSMGPGPGLDALVGTQVKAWISPSGQFYSSKVAVDDPTGQMASVGNEVTRLLPRIRTALAPGARWTDTSTSRISQGGMDVDRTVVSEYTVSGDTVIGQQKVWKVARKSTSTSSGSGNAQGQAMTLNGTSTGTGALYLSQQGAFVGGESDEEASAKITLAANGLEVHVGTKAKTTVVRLD